MGFIRKFINAEWALRLSLGAMYLYSGIDIIRHPNSWTWAIRALPDFLQNIINQFGGAETFLFTHGIMEIAFAAVLLLWFMPRPVVRLVGLLGALEMASIVLFVGVTDVTFRDIGLIGAGLALFLLRR